MRRYGPLVFKSRWFHRLYDDAHVKWRNDIASCLGRSAGEMPFTRYSLCAKNSFCTRQYSSVGVNMIPTSVEDIRTDGISQNIDFYKQGDSSFGGGSLDYRQNQSSPASHYYATNDRTSRQFLGHYTTEKIGVNLQHAGYSDGWNNAAFSNHQNASNGVCEQSPSSVYMGNEVVNRPGGYQQGHVSSNASVPLATSSRYSNVRTGSYQQNFNGFQDPNILPQSQVSATPAWRSTEIDKFIDDKISELENFCKGWDLISAMDTMRELSNKGVLIDMRCYLILIDACGKAKALKEAKDVHQHLISYVSPVHVSIFNRILEMYGKCDSMEDAYETFNNMRERNLTTWDTMITWLSKNGLGEEAIDMFTKFKKAGLKPDGHMFLGVIDACGVLGDVTEGLLHLDSMAKTYGITPTMVHYARIVHMFGSAGDLDGALEFIDKMPVEPSIDVWESLMNIARVQGNVEIGDRCAQIVEQLDPARLRKESRDGLLPVDPDAPTKKVKKHNPLEHISHDYRAGDQSHPEKDKIYTVLRGLKECIKEAGYIPDTRFVLHDIDPEGKEEAIMAHSERLAATYALLTSGARHQFRVIKNLRVCGDCHNYFKILSDIVGREIIMRDAKRFHHFKDGKCSCNDYW